MGNPPLRVNGAGTCWVWVRAKSPRPARRTHAPLHVAQVADPTHFVRTYGVSVLTDDRPLSNDDWVSAVDRGVSTSRPTAPVGKLAVVGRVTTGRSEPTSWRTTGRTATSSPARTRLRRPRRSSRSRPAAPTPSSCWTFPTGTRRSWRQQWHRATWAEYRVPTSVGPASVRIRAGDDRRRSHLRARCLRRSTTTSSCGLAMPTTSQGSRSKTRFGSRTTSATTQSRSGHALRSCTPMVTGAAHASSRATNASTRPRR